jgi:AraC family transcriptional regulator of adaptative response / DNA-3-methyladenine glycosylase II
VDVVDGRRYARTVRIGDAAGVVLVEEGDGEGEGPRARAGKPHLRVDVSLSLIPALMPVLARLRQVLDLDAEPLQIDAQLADGGLGAHVAQRAGVRVAGAFDGFELACRTLLRVAVGNAAATELAGVIARTLGEPLTTGIPELTHLSATAERVGEAGAARLASIGVPRATADVIAAVARAIAERRLRLEPGSDVASSERMLAELGIDPLAIATLVMRALHWPDGFPAASPALQHAAGVTSATALLAAAERWRPWRSYAAVHLWLRTRPV